MPRYSYGKRLTCDDIAAELGIPAGRITVEEKGDSVAVVLPRDLTADEQTKLDALMRLMKFRKKT